MYPALSIVYWFLSQMKMTPMKVQKLIFFAHGWYLALTERPLLNEKIEAWAWGPVIPSVYHRLKKYGNDEIDINSIQSESEFPEYEMTVSLEPKLEALLEKILSEYGKYTAAQLSSLSHEKGGPWDDAVKKAANEDGELLRNTDISNAIIRDYFKKQRASKVG